jgi:hypothetical protein
MDLGYLFTTSEAKLLLIGVFFLGVVFTLIFVVFIVLERRYFDNVIKDYRKRAEIWAKKINEARTCVDTLTPHVRKFEHEHDEYRRLFDKYGKWVDEKIKADHTVEIDSNRLTDETGKLFPQVGFCLLLLDDKRINKLFFKFVEAKEAIPLDDKSPIGSKEEEKILDKFAYVKALIGDMQYRLDKLATKYQKGIIYCLMRLLHIVLHFSVSW